MPSSREQPTFMVLGPIEVSDVSSKSLGGPKQRAVLAMLISRIGEIVANESLIDGIWGENPPPEVGTSLRSYVSNLRTATSAEITRLGSGYRLEADPESVDANQFQGALVGATKALSANPEAASDRLRGALALWRGRPYADVSSCGGLQSEIRRLEEMRLEAVEARVGADLALGRHASLIGELAALTAEHPLREKLQGALMVALYRDGRQSEALRQFTKVRNHLRDELGVDPSPELAHLELRILNHDPDLLSVRDAVTETVAFLFTDIADSTQLWEVRSASMRTALAKHDEFLEGAVEHNGGRVFKHTGDGVLAAFPTVPAAASAAAAAQGLITETDWGDLDLTVRMAIDVGEVDARGGDYFGPPLNRCARILGAGHGGQILLSESAQQAIAGNPGTQIRSLGEQRLKGLGAPVRVFQLLVEGLETEFPTLRRDSPGTGAARQFGDAIRGYEVRQRLSATRVSVVYRAFQPTVGREVAVKMIRPEYANHPSFVRRFEAEAITVAGLEHPHIVALYDYWRDSDGAYLVMPLLSGGSLADRELGAMPLEGIIGMINQVGAALGHAHRHGVIHRDLKPSNILMDGDGNAYLSDFGIAVRDVERSAGIQSDSAIFRAPEDQAGGPVDERSDIYSFGLVIAGLLTGSFEVSPDLSSVEGPLRQLLDETLAPDLARRPASVSDFVGRMNALNGGMPSTPEPVVARNPYKGLQAFDISDARDFHGRDAEIARLTEMVGDKRLVTVVGPSGSGKSSLVKAGLVAALARGALPGSDRWITLATVPGSHPIDELASALGRVATEPMGDMVSEMEGDDRGLLRLSKRLLADIEGELLIVVDQFEELYTIVDSSAVRERFIANLLAATADARSRVRVVITLRADFFDHPLADDALGSIVSESNLALAVPRPSQLREAIARPADDAGLRFDEGLIDRIVSDVQEQPGSLPLLQFTLTALASGGVDGRVTAEAYESLGRVSGALTRRADDAYEALTEDERQAAEEIFLRLVSVSEDADDVRRRVRRSELEAIGLDPDVVGTVLAAFGDARLLTFDRDATTRGPTVEVAHEALLRSWGRFRSWLEARREALVLHRRFRFAVSEWEEADRDPAYLLTEGRLEQFEGWASTGLVSLTADERAYLDESVEVRDTAFERKRTIRRGVMAGFGIAAVVAGALAVAAVLQRNEAREQTDLARSNELALRARREIPIDPERAVLLSLEAIDLGRRAGFEPAEAVRSLRSSIAADRILIRIPGQADAPWVATSPDGSLLAAPHDGVVEVYDTQTWQSVSSFAQSGTVPTSAAFDGSSRRLAVAYAQASEASEASPVIIYDLADGTETHVDGEMGAPGFEPKIAFARDGVLGDEWLFFDRLVAGDPPTLALERWQIESDAGAGVVAEDVRFSIDPRGRHLVTSDYETGLIQITDLTSLEMWTAPEASHRTESDTMSHSPDGSMLAETSQDQGRLTVRDAMTGEVTFEWDLARPVVQGWIDDATVAIGSEGSTKLVDITTGRVTLELAGHTSAVFSGSRIRGTDMLATASHDGGVIIWDISEGGPRELQPWRTGLDEFDVIFPGHDGGVIAGRLWIRADGRPVELTAGCCTAISQNGSYVSVENRVYSVSDGSEVYVGPRGATVTGVNNDATMVVQRTVPFGLEVLDTRTRETVSRLEGAGDNSYYFTPDSRLVYSRCCGEGPPIFRTATGESAGDAGHFVSMSGPSGRLIALSPPGSGIVWLIDAEQVAGGADLEGARLAEVSAQSGLLWPGIDVHDERLATTSFDEPVRIWDISGVFDGVEPSLISEIEPFPRGGPPTFVFSADGGELISVGVRDQLLRFIVDTDELMDLARSRLSRSLTSEECATYGIEPCPGAVEGETTQDRGG